MDHASITLALNADFLNTTNGDSEGNITARYKARKAANPAKAAGQDIPALFDPGSDGANVTWDNEPYG